MNAIFWTKYIELTAIYSKNRQKPPFTKEGKGRREYIDPKIEHSRKDKGKNHRHDYDRAIQPVLIL
jgi:hypothetical protein